MSAEEHTEDSVFHERFQQFSDLLLKIPSKRDISCKNFDKNYDKKCFIAKPRYNDPFKAVSENEKKDIDNFYRFISDFINENALEHHFFKLEPFFCRNKDEKNYKSSLWVLLENAIFKTNEVYGDYLVEKENLESKELVSIYYSRRKKKKRNLINQKSYSCVDDIKEHICRDAILQVTQELKRRLNLLYGMLTQIEKEAKTLDHSLISDDDSCKFLDQLIKNEIESHKLEFKSTIPKERYHIIKIICAFANHDGGDIYFGIEDNPHKICGFENNQKVEEHISNFLKKIEPKPKIKYITYNYSENLSVFRVHVKKSDDLIMYDGRFPYRDINASSVRNMTQNEIVQRIQNQIPNKTKIIEKEYISEIDEESKEKHTQKLFELLIQYIEQYFSDQPRLNIEHMDNYKPYFRYLGLIIRGPKSLEFLEGKYIFRPDFGFNPLIPLSQSFPPLRSESFDIHSTYDVYPYATFESRLELYFEIIHWAKEEFSIDLCAPDDKLPNDIEYVRKILNNLISAIEANDPRQLSKDLNIPKKKYLLLHYTNCNEILDRSKKQFRNLNEIQLDTYHLGYDTNEIRIFNNKHPQQDWEDLSETQKSQYKKELIILFSGEIKNLEEYWINPEKKKKILQEFISAFEKDDWKTIYNITQNPTLEKFIIQFPEIIIWKREYINNPLVLKEGDFILFSSNDQIILRKKENDQILKFESFFYPTKNLQIKDDYIQMLKKLLV